MTTTAPIVLSDLIPFPRVMNRTWVRDAVLVLSAALFTALCAQITVHLGFTPVPLTGQTFAVLSVGGILGTRRAMASQVVYWALGATGLPFYAANKEGIRGGWSIATGSTFGYFVGFVVAAGVVGWFADRRDDRNYVSSLSAMFLASGIIYTLGALWLSHAANIPLYSDNGGSAIDYGVTPFLVGDVVKMALAAAIAPLGWASYYAKPR
jgi:biotin transport system substrate-specific component